MKRVNVNFSEEVYTMIKELANKKGQTMADTLRDAIALEVWVQKVELSGGRLLVEKDGVVREVVRI